MKKFNDLVNAVVKNWISFAEKTNEDSYYEALDELLAYCEESELVFPFDAVIDGCQELYADYADKKEFSREYIESQLIEDCEYILSM